MYRYGAKVCPDMQTVSPRSAAEVAGWGASLAAVHPAAHLRRPTLRVPGRLPLADSLVPTAAVLWLSPAARHLPTWGVLLHDTWHV